MIFFQTDFFKFSFAAFLVTAVFIVHKDLDGLTTEMRRENVNKLITLEYKCDEMKLAMLPEPDACKKVYLLTGSMRAKKAS